MPPRDFLMQFWGQKSMQIQERARQIKCKHRILYHLAAPNESQRGTSNGNDCGFERSRYLANGQIRAAS